MQTNSNGCMKLVPFKLQRIENLGDRIAVLKICYLRRILLKVKANLCDDAEIEMILIQFLIITT